MRSIFIFLLLLGFLIGCASTRPKDTTPSISHAQLVALLPSFLKDREGWADDISEAIEKLDRSVTFERACAVIAVIEQESGFQIDPPVKNLPQIVRRGLERKFKKLGPMAGVAVEAVLQIKAPGAKKNFKDRIAKLKTESDLDRLFRDIENSVRNRYRLSIAIASLISKLSGHGWLEDFNPVTTAGPMQVKVSYAKTLSGLKDLSDAEVRDALYTRKGGVRAGAARLLDYEANYTDVLYRFADYNAGVYSSRNAAFQSMLSELTGASLEADGDLLSYRSDEKPSDETTRSLKAMIEFGEKNDLSERSVRRASKDEKSFEFEESEIWKAVRAAWENKTRKAASYARIPNVTLDSPKMSTRRSTQWFAESVKKRYETCRRRKR